MGYARVVTRALLTAEILSIGTELTTGTTRDTNAGDLARDLTALGVTVARVTALPDVLSAVTEVVRRALDEVDLVVSTGGLGPTPDDLTREAIAAAIGEAPAVDPALERWLRALWTRRGLDFPEANLKQAWLVPSATAVANPTGRRRAGGSTGRTAGSSSRCPVRRARWGRCGASGSCRGSASAAWGSIASSSRYARSRSASPSWRSGCGDLLDAAEPSVATYARPDGVDVRVAAVDGPGGSAAALADGAVATILARVGEHVWGRDGDTWPHVVGAGLLARGWRVAVIERGTEGAATALLGSMAGLVRATVVALDGPVPDSIADEVRAETDADVVVTADARDGTEDTRVTIRVHGPGSLEHKESRTILLRGDVARARLGAAVAHVLLGVVRSAA